MKIYKYVNSAVLLSSALHSRGYPDIAIYSCGSVLLDVSHIEICNRIVTE